jgi:hypothetical protein
MPFCLVANNNRSACASSMFIRAASLFNANENEKWPGLFGQKNAVYK